MYQRCAGGSIGAASLAAFLAVALAGLLPAPGRAAPRPEFHGLPIRPAVTAAEFVLRDQHDRFFSMRAQRGRAILLVFGYTSCPDVCPATLGILKQVYGLLGPAAGRVRVVFVTTDPARDTRARLKRYLTLFHPAFLGLTGSRDALLGAYQEYGIYPQRYTAAGTTGYRVSHATALFLIDPAGYVRFSYNWGAAPRDVAYDVRLLLAGY